jgi:polyisoprenoid-binding protein YceI
VATALAAGAATAAPVSSDPAKAPAGVYVLDPRHASLVVKIAHMGGFSRYTMRFDRMQGTFTYDPATWRSTPATIEIDAASIDTGDRSFDKTIAQFFEADKFPKIVFAAQSIEPAADPATSPANPANPANPAGTSTSGSTGKLIGNLTFHGVTRPVTLDVTFNGLGPGLLGLGTRIGFSGSGRIRRSDFGVTAVHQYAGDDVDLLFEVEFARK